VRALRIRAPNEDQARRAAIVAEDALRTATFPGDGGGRVVFIRRLDVGVIPRGSPPSSVALAMEAAVQRMAADAVHAEAPDARDAAMVYFRDETEPLVALARAIANDRQPDAWFWPLAVRGWSAAAPPLESLRLLAQRALETRAGAVTVAHVIATLLDTEHGESIVGALSESDARALLAAVGYVDGVDGGVTATPVAVRSDVRRAVERAVARSAGRVDDPRAVLVAVVMVISERPARAASPMLGAIVSGVMRAVERAGAERMSGSSGVSESGWRASRGGMVATAVDGLQRSEGRHVDSQAGGAPRPPIANAAQPNSQPAPPHLAADSALPLPLPHVWEHPRPTTHAGFLFVVALLHQRGIANLLANRPDLTESGWLEDLLLRLARRLGIPKDDPTVAWLAAPPTPLAPSSRALTAIWLRAIRGHVRHHAGKSLASVVHRRGAIVATRTHIDVLMRYSQVDIAIRRAGLDLDPGWLPWLGRVVQFHYLDVLPPDDPA
jgi:hypothetical protein